MPTSKLTCRTLRRTFLIGGTLLAGLICAMTGRAQPIVFTNFNSTGGLTLTSSSTAATTTDGNVLRLVGATSNDVGAAFSTTQLNLANGFSTAFDFRLSNRGGSSDGTAVGADGFVFTIQRAGASAIGAAGEGMGFLNIGAASVGVEFDTFQNSNRGDPSSNHVGINTGGSVNSLATAPVGAEFDNGTKWSAWIDYNGSILEVRVSNNGVRPASANLTYSLNLANTLGGNAGFVGFTAATGGAYANHDILAWTYSDSFVPGGVTAGLAIPEPSTYALLVLGLGAVLVVGRRKLRRGR